MRLNNIYQYWAMAINISYYGIAAIYPNHFQTKSIYKEYSYLTRGIHFFEIMLLGGERGQGSHNDNDYALTWEAGCCKVSTKMIMYYLNHSIKRHIDQFSLLFSSKEWFKI